MLRVRCVPLKATRKSMASISPELIDLVTRLHALKEQQTVANSRIALLETKTRLAKETSITLAKREAELMISISKAGANGITIDPSPPSVFANMFKSDSAEGQLVDLWTDSAPTSLTSQPAQRVAPTSGGGIAIRRR